MLEIPRNTVSNLWLIIGQTFASGREVYHFNTLARGDSLRISGQTLPLQKP